MSLKVTVLDAQEALQRSNILYWTWVVCVNKETVRGESTAALVSAVTTELQINSKGYSLWVGKSQKYSDSLQAGRFGDRIPVGGDIFRTCSDRPWGPDSLL